MTSHKQMGANSNSKGSSCQEKIWWDQIPMVNLLHEFFDLRDPLTPDQLNMMMDIESAGHDEYFSSRAPT